MANSETSVNSYSKRLFALANRAMIRSSNLLFSSILRTPPIPVNPNSDSAIYSILNKPNRNAYILAAKSFLLHYQDVALVVQNDGSLSDRCKSLLESHLPGVQIVDPRASFEKLSANLPANLRSVIPRQDACHFFVYYQLLFILYCIPHRRIVQMDSDILFIKRPDYIIAWLQGQASDCFYGGGGNSLSRKFHELGFRFDKVSVDRFNAGLFGISGRPADDSVGKIFETLSAKSPASLMHWEAAQAIWSVLLNECSDPFCLDELDELYIGNGWKSYKDLQAHSRVVHFVGTTRFRELSYLRFARQIARKTKASFS